MVAGTNGDLYVGGTFTTAGGIPASCIAKWTGSAWTNLGSGMASNSMIIALALGTNGELYAGGSFKNAGGVPATNIAKWTGTGWTNLGSGMNSLVLDLAMGSNGELFACGYFTSAGGIPANRVAKWDGTTWTNLGAGMLESVDALTLDTNGILYAGGSFLRAETLTVNGLAKWNGTAWTNVGSASLRATADLKFAANGELYAGGTFAGKVAKWNGAMWTKFGSNLDNFVYTLLATSNGELFAGGWFTNVGDTKVNFIAQWDGTCWTNVGVGFDAYVCAMAQDTNGEVFAGGSFLMAGDIAVNGIAKWWQPPTPWPWILGTNHAILTNGEAASVAKGTDFGGIVWGAASTNMFAITNAGSEDLIISGWSINGAGASSFQIDGMPNAVAAESSSNFSVIFSPIAGGIYSATLQIDNNSTPCVVSLTGTGAKQEQAALTFIPSSPQAYNTTQALTASGGSGTGVLNFVVISGPGQIVNATELAITSSTGLVTVAATKMEDANYNSIVVTGIVICAKSDQTIAFAAIADQSITSVVNLNARASSGLSVSFAVSSGSARITGGTNLSFTGTGTVSIVASQAGDSNWNAAPNVTNSFEVVAAPVPALPAPANLAASNGRYADQVALVWTAVSAASGYSIWRHAADDSSAAAQVGTTAETRYSDTSARGGTVYYYWVKATNAAAVSAFSASASGWRRSANYPSSAEVDLDGDRKMDLAIVDRLTGTWCAQLSASAYASALALMGGPGYSSAPGDYDGDLKTDPAVYDEMSGLWLIRQSASDYQLASATLGGPGCAPTPGDYDGDRKTDPGVYEAASGAWQTLLSAGGYAAAETIFGEPDYLPVQRDYDGDLKSDPAIYHLANGAWRVMLSASDYGEASAAGFGGTGYAPVVGDYDADGLADPAIYHEATGLWTVMLSGSGYLIAYGTLGGSGYAALPGDYDGDGKTDPGVYHTTTGQWLVLLSGSGYGIATAVFGGEGYDPVGLR